MTKLPPGKVKVVSGVHVGVERQFVIAVLKKKFGIFFIVIFF
jgi:hypothetical protein